MAVFRINKTKNYTVMSNYHLKDRGLSLKAKGLLSLMLSLPDEWDYSISGLCAICVESESAVNSALKELKKRGYLRVDKIMPDKTSTGRIEYEYNIFEQPCEKQGIEKQGLEIQPLEIQPLEIQPLEIQGLENQGQLNTKESSTKKSNTKESSTKYKKESKKEARQSFDELIDAYTKNEELRKALREYIQMRTAIRKKITNRGLELAFNTLDKLANNDAEKVAIVNQSIMNSWQGLFALKGNNAYKQQNQPPKDEDNEAVKKARDKWGDLPGFKIV